MPRDGPRRRFGVDREPDRRPHSSNDFAEVKRARIRVVMVRASAAREAVSAPSRGPAKDGGESGIRTHEAVLAPTRFPIVLLQPLGHLSAMGYVIEFAECAGFWAEIDLVHEPELRSPSLRTPSVRCGEGHGRPYP